MAAPPMREAVVQKLFEGIQKGCRHGVNEAFLDDLRSRTAAMDASKGPTSLEVEAAIRLFREHASERNNSMVVPSSDYSSNANATPPPPAAPPAPDSMPRPLNPSAGTGTIPPTFSTNSSNSGHKQPPPPPTAIPAAPARPPAPPTSSPIGLPPSLERARGVKKPFEHIFLRK